MAILFPGKIFTCYILYFFISSWVCIMLVISSFILVALIFSGFDRILRVIILANIFGLLRNSQWFIVVAFNYIASYIDGFCVWKDRSWGQDFVLLSTFGSILYLTYFVHLKSKHTFFPILSLIYLLFLVWISLFYSVLFLASEI